MMTALSILGFGLLGLSAMQVDVMRGAQGSRGLTGAVWAAQAELEGLMRQSWADVPTTGWTTPAAPQSQVDASVDPNAENYLVSRRVSDVVAGETRSIDVRVTWTDSLRGNRQYSLSTVKFNDGT